MRWKPGHPEQYPLPSTVTEANALIEGEGGTLLLATDAGLKQVVNGKIEPYALPGITGHFRPTRFFRSSDGSLWIGTQQGLLHPHHGKTDKFGVADGLSGDFIATIFEDREGSVWVATQGGLDRFREYAVSTASANQGLSTSYAWCSVQATSDGSIWIGAANGLNRLQNGRVTLYGGAGPRQVSAEEEDRKAPARAITRYVPNSGLSGTPESLGRDDQGRVWVSTSDGVFFSQDDRFIRVAGVPGGYVLSIAADGRGKVWISNRDHGVLYVSSDGPAQPIPWSLFGQKPFGGRVLPDRSQGGVWLGFFDGGIAYLNDGQVHASYSATDGLGNGHVNDLRFGSRGTLWASTDGGLSRIKNGRVATLTSQNGLPCDGVHWSAEDDDHFVWLNMSCGLARIARSELDAWVSDPKRKVQATLFDASDGVRTVGLVPGYGPLVTESPDGKLWFGTPDGVQIIDPHHLAFNKIPPPVHIEQMKADGKVHDVASAASGQMRLPPLVRDLTIDYTAPSLAVPEKVHFRFKLEGQDKDWREVVNNRQVQYSNLRPRNYRFRVTACNNSGVWNEEGAFLDFSIDPAYYQTIWFRALCVAAFLALLWAVYQLRLRQVAREFNMTLEARVGERTRIARDLHDTLLQSFHGILLHLQIVSNELGSGQTKERIDTVIDQAEHAIVEGRNAVQGLRDSTVERNDLAFAIRTLGEELAAADSNSQRPEFSVQMEGTARNLHPILRDEVYRIAGEAMRNAFSHASAQRIEVEIRYDERHLRVRIRDDGKGIDLQLLGENGREGHFGLRGMRERAKLIGGKLTVWSELDSGTEVELSIPAARAYATAPERRSGLVEKLAGKLTGKSTELKS